MIKLELIAVTILAMMHFSSANMCQVCMATNGAYCESENEYYICVGDTKFGPLFCGVDEVCTSSKNVCEKKSTAGIQNICGDQNGECQACVKNQKVTCVSKTQAAVCTDGVLSPNAITNCDENEICSLEALEVFDTACVPKCVADFAQINSTCSNDVYTPPTEVPPTTPNPAEMQTICTAAAVGKTSRFFYTYADWTCRTYVYCERKTLSSTYFETTFTGSCASPKIYFNTVGGKCESTMPESCRTNGLTTTTRGPTTRVPTTQTIPTARDSDDDRNDLTNV